ncbi:MAG: hypothetical protein RSA84_09680, partial [Acinetobacter sp.]
RAVELENQNQRNRSERIFGRYQVLLSRVFYNLIMIRYKRRTDIRHAKESTRGNENSSLL